MREPLPPRRRSETIDIESHDQRMKMTVGYYPDGRPGEVFISGIKTGQQIDSLMRDTAVLLSIALQYGTPLTVLAQAITRDPQLKSMSFIGGLLDHLAKEQEKRE